MLQKPMIFYPYNYCHNCKTNSIELYSWHNYPQKYAKILDQYEMTGNVPATLDKYGIYTMRCNRCGKEYKIFWDGKIPRPIHNEFDIQLFMNKFKSDSLKGRPKIINNIYEENLK